MDRTKRDGKVASTAPTQIHAPKPSATPPPLATYGLREPGSQDIGREADLGQGAGHPRSYDEAGLALRELLGAGGMGEVWAAEQLSLARSVAVKTSYPSTPDGALLTEREARLHARLNHPAVIPIHDLIYPKSTASPIIVFRRIEGASWDKILSNSDHPSWRPLAIGCSDRLESILRVMMRIASAAHHAHKQGIIHCDIKPSNIVIDDDGECYLVDWGIALDQLAARADAVVGGTPGFIAPELARGDVDSVDARTDVYLLGATLHAALTGEPRHAGRSREEVMVAAMVSLPVDYPGHVPPELAAICNQATHSDPGQRFASADAFREAIARYLEQRSARAALRQASEQLDALTVRMSSGNLDAEARTLALECRIAYRNVARSYPDMTFVQAGYRGCLTTLFDFEVKCENVNSAESIVAELADPSPEIRQKLEELRAREAEKQRALFEQDTSQVAPGFRWLLIALGGVSLLLGVSAIALALAGAHAVPAHLRYATPPVVLLITTATVLAARPRFFLINRVARQLAITVALTALWVALFRVGVTTRGEYALRNLFWVESGTAALAFGIASALVERVLWASLVVALASAVLTWSSPAMRDFGPAFAFLTFLVVLVEGIGGQIWRRRDRKPT